MARPSNPEIRARLREQAVEYVMSHGAADLTLRPLAKALKTSARMLMYHFGSREGLMRDSGRPPGAGGRAHPGVVSQGKDTANACGVSAHVLAADE